MIYTLNITALFLAATMVLNYDYFVDARLGGETGNDHHRDLESSQDDGVYR